MRNYMRFKGESNAEHGIVIEKMPTIPALMERGESIVIPGREGEVWHGEGVPEPVLLPVQVWVSEQGGVSGARRWLTGEGDLYLGSDAFRWRARVDQHSGFVPCAFNDGWRATVTFACLPYRQLDGAELRFAESPAAIGNLYGVETRPLIAIDLTGDAEIDFCGTEFELFDLTGTVWLDCELPECYTEDGAANDHMRGRFPRIPAGGGAVTWTGGVASLRVLPRWRQP